MEKVFTQDELEQSTSFIKYCTRPDAAVQKEWEAYIAAHPAEAGTVAKAKVTVQSLYSMLGDVDADEAAEAFRQLLNEQEEQRPRRFWLPAAAVLLLLLAAGGLLVWRSSGNSAVVATLPAQKLQTAYGTKFKRVLPDGTTVWLNAGSKLSYAGREATLEGEAFFDVAKDADHPFIVHAEGVTIEVLGTSFNLKAYCCEESIEATLITGKIRVQLSHDPDKKFTLAPNEKLIIRRMPANTRPKAAAAPPEVQVQPVVMPDNIPYYAETAWVNDALVFNNETFAEVAAKLERWYDVRIRFEDAGLQQEELSGVFEHENIEQALQLLQMTTRFKYRMENNEIVIY